MFRNLRPTLVAAALTVGALIPAFAGAEIFRYRSSGDSATASFSTGDATGCVWTYVDVYVNENQVRVEAGPSEPATYVNLSLFGFDLCQGTYIYDLYANAIVPDSAFRISGNLQSASLQTTVEAYNWMTGAVESMTLDLTWTGEGDVHRGHNNNHSSYPGVRYMSRSNGSYRVAVPSGSVTFQGTNLLAAAQYVYGSLNSSQSSYTTITRSH